MSQEKRDRIVSELKDLAWNHHSSIDDRINEAANKISLYGGLELKEVDELYGALVDCQDLTQKLSKLLRVIEKEAVYAG